MTKNDAKKCNVMFLCYIIFNLDFIVGLFMLVVLIVY